MVRNERTALVLHGVVVLVSAGGGERGLFRRGKNRLLRDPPAVVSGARAVCPRVAYKAGSQSNGGMVCCKNRYPSQIVGVCRPTYKEEEQMPKTDYDTHWAREHIQWGLDTGIITGYQDGSFKPDQACTRAEIATMLHRHDARLRIDMEARAADLRQEIDRLRREIAELRAKVN